MFRLLLAFLNIDPESFDVLFLHFEQYYVCGSGDGTRGRPTSIPVNLS
jgi:hypothetical protein